MTLPGFKDFDPNQKPQSKYVPRFVSNNTGLVCLLGLLLFPVVVGFSFGYLLVVIVVGAYRKVRGEKSREEAAKEASQKIQVVLGEKVVDCSFPNTVSLNVQQGRGRTETNTTRKYHYHRLSSQSDTTSNGHEQSNYDSTSDVDSEKGSRGKTDDPDNDSGSSTHASLEDNIEDELENVGSSKEAETSVSEKEQTDPANSKVCNGTIEKQILVKNSNMKSKNNLRQSSKKNNSSGVVLLEEKEKIFTSAVIDEDKPSSPVLSDGKFGRLRFALHYNVAKNELQVNIIKAVDLPVANNKTDVNSFVKICLLPQQFCWQRTKVIEATCDPVFNETFIISGFSKERMKEYVLQFRVINYHDWFYDRYGDDVMGEIHFPLSELKIIDNRPSFSLTKWMNLQLSASLTIPENLGEICASICFRPISGRLIITITRIRGLPKAADGRTDPYVKIALYCEGVRLSKANTRVKRRSTNPVYNEKFNFNVSADEISLTTVVLKIVNHGQVNSSGGSMGTVVLGFDSIGSGQEHWNSMIESPSRHTEKWHKLCKDTSL